MADIKTNNSLSFFSYDNKKVIDTADAGKQTLNDWNRHIRATEKCGYFINGTKLSELRAEMLKEGQCSQLEFTDVDELKQFFKAHLFKDLKDEQASMAATQACLQWHQSGIQHATYQHTWSYALKNFPNIQLSAPTSNVHFTSTETGVLITENNAYREWTKMHASGTADIFTRSEKEAHFAQTNTTYLFTPDRVELLGLSIDCSVEDLYPLFDKKPEENTLSYLTNRFFIALYAFIASLFSDYSPIPQEESAEDTSITYKHPTLK